MARLPVFRFSLRALFVAVTLSAIGAWWWQRPYTEELPDLGTCGTWDREITEATFRRSLLGKPIQHGIERRYKTFRDKKLLASISNWSDGKLHGIYEQFDWEGRLVKSGTYVNGLAHGLWTSRGERTNGITEFHWGKIRKQSDFFVNKKKEEEVTVMDFDPAGHTLRESRHISGQEFPRMEVQYRTIALSDSKEVPLMDGPITSWHRNGEKQYEGTFEKGQPSGRWRFWDSSGKLVHTLTFEEGVLIDHNGRVPIKQSFLASSPPMPNSGELNAVFWRWSVCEFKEVPLADVTVALHERHKYFSPQLKGEASDLASARITCEWRDLPMAIGLYLITEPLGLTTTLRNDQLRITTPTELARWKSRVLIEPNHDGLPVPKPIMDALGSQTELEFLDTPLGECADFIGLKHKISCKLSPTLLPLAKKRGFKLSGSPAEPIGQQLGDDCFLCNENLRAMTLQSALENLLEDLDLVCVVTENGLEIGAPPEGF